MSDTTMNEVWVTVATFQEPSEANMARAALESMGIAVNLRSGMANQMMPLTIETELQVGSADESAARAALDAEPMSDEELTAAEMAGELGE